MSRSPRVVSGMKPTGRLHLGNLFGALETWVRLQAEAELFCFVADWHALTVLTEPVAPSRLRAHSREVALDILAAGVDPRRAALFVQSDVKEHAELYLLLGMIAPLGWLERVPAYKDRRVPSPSHGLLGYPVLQAADVLLYRADRVPVGADQLPHLELAREVARRANHLFGPLFPLPEAVLATTEVLPGLDGRKMSKSYGNVVYLADSPEVTAAKIERAFTTPSKVRRSDPGIPEMCVVCRWRRAADPEGFRTSWEEDRRGVRGCAENKRELAELLNARLAPLRARRRELTADLGEVERILAAGAARARDVAAVTMVEVRNAVGVR